MNRRARWVVLALLACCSSCSHRHPLSRIRGLSNIGRSLTDAFNASVDPLASRTFPEAGLIGGSSCLRQALGEPAHLSLGASPFAYTIVSSGRGYNARFTARAFGDLDCDGVVSTFELVGHVNAQGQAETASGFWESEHPD